MCCTVLKTGSAELVAYRQLLSNHQQWLWLQSSVTLVYKNFKPHFVSAIHRVLSSALLLLLNCTPVMLVLVLKDSLRTKMQSLSWSLTMQSLSLLLKSLSMSLNKSPCDCVQFYLKVNLLKRHVHGAS